jgi:superfamily II DNA or RNA helicase
MEDLQTSGNLGLRGTKLEPEYNTEDDDIVNDLYAPCFEVSQKYDRAVGYFRANIYRELGEALLNFVISGGRVRIVCSPNMPEPDEEAAREGYDLRGSRTPEEEEGSLIYVLEAMSNDPKEADCLEMLRLLIESGSLDLFVAVRRGGIYHRKIGAFHDENGNIVAFSGSGNETRSAVSSIEDWGNDEEFDVYRSWGDGFESSKALKKAEYLERLFAGGTKYTEVRPLNEIERELISRFRSHSQFEACRPGARERRPVYGNVRIEKTAYTPRYYQEQAIEAWKSACGTGMLSMATATGKTITALLAISPLVHGGKPILILVPNRIIMSQWYVKIRECFPDVPVLLAGGGYNWRGDSKKRIYVSEKAKPRIILSTMSTASTDDFIEFFKQAELPVLVADEAHRIGSPVNRRILTEIDFKERLGLSSTPERLFDEEGQQALENAFGSSPVYSLPLEGRVKMSKESSEELPIIGTFLSKYDYHFEVVNLNSEEQERWNKKTSEIKRVIARNPELIETDNLRDDEAGRLRHLFIERARILKRAQGKMECVCKVISERYPPNGRWIIYCEDRDQLRDVMEALRSRHKHLTLLTYHSEMVQFEKDLVLDCFEHNPGIVVSIRCLDEGVDIPKIDGAIILASSKNPREYIQRRGRVLRRALGKRKATIVDAIVLPSLDAGDDSQTLPIVRGELARAWNFAGLAENQEVTHQLWRLAKKYGVNIHTDGQISFEEDNGGKTDAV